MKYTLETKIQVHKDGPRKGLPTGLRTPVGKETAEEVPMSKVKQNESIATLTVTTSKGVWKGNEASVNRMTNAERQLEKKDKTKPDKAPHKKLWKMADNSKADVTASDLSEALDLIADKMDAIIDA